MYKHDTHTAISTIQEMNLTEEDVEFIAKVTRELQNYLGCLEKVGYDTDLPACYLMLAF